MSFFEDVFDFVTFDLFDLNDSRAVEPVTFDWGNYTMPGQEALMANLIKQLGTDILSTQQPWQDFVLGTQLSQDQLEQLRTATESGASIPEELKQNLNPQMVSLYEDITSGDPNKVAKYINLFPQNVLSQIQSNPSYLYDNPEVLDQLSEQLNPFSNQFYGYMSQQISQAEAGVPFNPATANLTQFTPFTGANLTQYTPFTGTDTTQFTPFAGDGSVYNAGWDTAQAENVNLTRQILNSALDQLPVDLENKQLFNQVANQYFDSLLNSPGAQQQISAETNYWQEVANEAQRGIDLGSITGNLTEDQKSVLDQQRENAYTMANTSLQRAVHDTLGTAVADLTNKGVLNSSVAVDFMDKFSQNILDTQQQTALGIENNYLSQELNMMNQNFTNRLQAELGRSQFIQGGAAAGTQTAGDYANLLGALGSNASLNEYLNYISGNTQFFSGLGEQSNQFYANLSELSNQYASGLISDETQFYSQLEELSNQFGVNLSSEEKRYYADLAEQSRQYGAGLTSGETQYYTNLGELSNQYYYGQGADLEKFYATLGQQGQQYDINSAINLLSTLYAGQLGGAESLQQAQTTASQQQAAENASYWNMMGSLGGGLLGSLPFL